MIRTKGEPGTGDVVQAVRHMRAMNSEIRRIVGMAEDEIYEAAKQLIHQEISFEEEYGQLLEENGFDPHQTSVPASSTVHFSANTHPKNGIK